MRLSPIAAVLLSAASTAFASSHYAYEPLQRREYITTSDLLASYDFVIAGGGLAGLVLASRLSEDANTTVLVLEAGDNGDLVQERIDVPTEAYYNGLVGTTYDWVYDTIPQSMVDNRTINWPRGKVLGGSSAINGMYIVRPSKTEFDSWASLQGNQTGASVWGWDSMKAAMDQSESFTPPSPTVQSEASIQYVAGSRGTSGPLHATYPGFLTPIIGDWEPTLNTLGIPSNADAYNGMDGGTFIATSAINPANWTRSYSKSAYIDPLPPRSNLHILVNQTVTRIIFGKSAGASGLVATAVEYATNGYQPTPWPTVGVNKEVLLNGGAIGSPNILMQSGVGPVDKLQAAGVAIVFPLPGVGQHVQDHLSTGVVFTTTAEVSAALHASGSMNAFSNGTANPYQSFINSATAYVNLTTLLGSAAQQFHSDVVNNMTNFANSLGYNPSTDSTVIAGYEAIYSATADFLPDNVGQVEMLLSTTGSVAGGASSIVIQAALQHPFSMGQLYIGSPNPFDYPVIDPYYFSHPADIVMLREGIKLARKIGQTQPLAGLLTAEVFPGPTVQTDDDWENFLRANIGTEYHPSGTCAMLPLTKGGVVDPTLKVYGLANVRVTDSSVYPIEFAAHLMAPTYGLAELAAQMIKAQYNGAAPPAALVTKTVPNPTSSTGQPNASTSNKSAGVRLSSSFVMVAAVLLSTLFAVSS